MRIKRLRLAGFKSFVDPAELLIEPGLTGVVGPNGCGKSNLLEAMRWAMGEGSAKSLRGAGMDDVIFAGTATRPARDFAEVSILADTEVSSGVRGEREVVRRIERGAGSAYRIDGRDVRARDVALLFADAATGAHSPALVSQGRIGAVIAAKPADRRAMLEEAAGIAGLHVRRREAETRLRATEANLVRVDELIADAATRVAALRRQARTAERYRAVAAAVRLAEARLIFARWRDAAAAADAAKRDAAVADTAVAAATEADRAAAAETGASTVALADARAALLAARDRASEAGHRLAGLRADLAAAERRRDELAAAARRIEEDRAREDALAHDAAAALDRLDGEAARLRDAVAATEAQAPLLDRRLVAAKGEARDAEVALAQALAAQASEAAEARVAAAALAAARTRLDRIDRDRQALAATVARLSEAGPLAAEREAFARARAAALASGEAARATLAGSETANRTASASRDAADARRAAARADLAALDAESAALARATQGGDRQRLAAQVAAAPGFERALAAALDDVLATQAADWAGAEPLPGDPPPPPGTARLAAHVTAPPALARRLAQLFVADADTGQPLAVGQRLVTRAGALRRWDGYRASGSGAATAERLERLNRLDALAAARPAAAAALAAAEAALADADAAIATLRREADAARAAVRAAEGDARTAQLAEDRAALALERLQAQRADLDARAARLDTDRDEAAAELARAEAALAALPDRSATDATVARLTSAADAARAAAAAARVERDTADRSAAATRERQAGVAAEAKGWRARSGEAARRLADMARREAAVGEEAALLASRPAELAARIAAEEEAHAAVRAEADRLAAAERDADAALRRAETSARAAAEALATAREARAGAAARAEAADLRRVEMGRLSGERFECPAPVLPSKAGFDSAAVRSPAEERAAHDRLIAERERIGPVNLVAETELAELEASGAGQAAERAELDEAVARLRGSIGTLNREGRQRLLAAFEAVDGHFRRLFAQLFGGGQAHLSLIDSDDPLEAGLEIMAQPPGKRLSALTLLSGGEQALTAVALIFGLFLTNPAPICVLDEVDAPLDDANIERFCGLLDAMTAETDTRYLIVTHNAVTMSRMHRLFGVTMIERGVSRLVSVDLQAAETMAAE